jgi:hypothetical protein
LRLDGTLINYVAPTNNFVDIRFHLRINLHIVPRYLGYCDKIILKIATKLSLGFSARRPVLPQTLHHAEQPHKILKVKGAVTGGLAPKLVRLRAIGETPLDAAWLALAVDVPEPRLAPINPHLHESKPLAAIRMKGMDDLELESATRVKRQRSVGLILSLRFSPIVYSLR